MIVKNTCKNKLTALISTARRYSHASPDIMMGYVESAKTRWTDRDGFSGYRNHRAVAVKLVDVCSVEGSLRCARRVLGFVAEGGCEEVERRRGGMFDLG